MKKSNRGWEALKDSLQSVQADDPATKIERAFAIWVCEAFLIESRDDAVLAVTDGPKDGGIDAIIIDDKNEQVFLIQTKYRSGDFAKLESYQDSRKLISAVRSIASESDDEYGHFLSIVDPTMHKRVEKARRVLVKRKYKARLVFASTGRFSEDHIKKAKSEMRGIRLAGDLRFIDRREVLLSAIDYALGATPPISELWLPVDSSATDVGAAAFSRGDRHWNLKSWVFSMKCNDVANIYKQAGDKIFARNIRGYLSDTDVNANMRETLQRSPERFWYYNNGITFICRAARMETTDESRLWVERPQIVNGQQTTRAMASCPKAAASALVKVIAVPPETIDSEDQMDDLISRIVECTNNQNPINPSDLRANDVVQIRLQRAFERAGYYYMRKRESRSELRKRLGVRRVPVIKRDELAQAIAACLLDPYDVRSGKEGLFQGERYQKIFAGPEIGRKLLQLELARRVKRVGSGHPDRAYAKWHCLNMVWSEIRGLLTGVDHKRLAETLRRGENGRGLDLAIADVYRALQRFYVKERKQKDRVLDISAFYYRPNIHFLFARYWNSRACKNRSAARSRFKKFVQQAVEAS